jgi:hypothetical protein
MAYAIKQVFLFEIMQGYVGARSLCGGAGSHECALKTTHWAGLSGPATANILATITASSGPAAHPYASSALSSSSGDPADRFAGMTADLLPAKSSGSLLVTVVTDKNRYKLL